MQDGEIPADLQLIPSSSLGIILNVRFYLNVHIYLCTLCVARDVDVN